MNTTHANTGGGDDHSIDRTAATELRPSPSPPVCVANISLPIFQSGWRKLRYPSHMSRPLTGSDTTTSASSSSSIQSFRDRFKSLPTLESLLVKQPPQPQSFQSKQSHLQNTPSLLYSSSSSSFAVAAAVKPVSIRSPSWTDAYGCQWSILLFPLGKIDTNYIGIFLEKQTPSLERNVRIEISLCPKEEVERRRRMTETTHPNQMGDVDEVGSKTKNQEQNIEDERTFPSSSETLSLEFCHCYMDTTQKGIGTTDLAQNYGIDKAFHQTDVLRNYITDDGYLLFTVYIHDILKPSSVPFSSDRTILDDGQGISQRKIITTAQNANEINRPTGASLLGRFPRIHRPMGMQKVQQDLLHTKSIHNHRPIIYDDTAMNVATHSTFKPVQMMEDGNNNNAERSSGDGGRYGDDQNPWMWRSSAETSIINATSTSAQPRLPLYAGLLNQGATCYMNALLQVWFHLPIFRNGVIDLPRQDDGENGDGSGDDDSSIYTYSSFTSEDESSCGMAEFDSEEMLGRKKRDDVSIKSPENVRKESVENDPQVDKKNVVKKEENVYFNKPTETERHVGEAIQNIFIRLALSSRMLSKKLNLNGIQHLGNNGNNAVSTSVLTRAFGWDSASLFRQHDVQELNRLLLDKLECVFQYQHQLSKQKGDRSKSYQIERTREKTKVKSVVPFLPYLFEGNVLSYIKCTSVDYSSTKVESFLDLNLQVKGCPTLYDSLEEFTREEELVGDNQYDASDAGHGKQDARKGVKIQTLPPVLNIHLKRFEFDSRTMGMVKVNDRCEFPLVLDTREFLVENSDTIDDGDMIDARENIYHLHSIIMHSGGVEGGHYTSYIRPKLSSYDVSVSKEDSAHKREWFKFDDDLVMDMNENEMLEIAYGGPLQRDEELNPLSDSRTEILMDRRSQISMTPWREGGDNNSSHQHNEVETARYRRSPSTSAYMLAYIKEVDLEWVLSNSNDALIESISNDLLNVKREVSSTKQAKGHLGPYMKVPIMTDADLLTFDSIEGAYIPRYIPKPSQGWTRISHDFALWDGHVPVDTNPASSNYRPATVKIRLGDTGFGLVRAIAVKLNVPMHRIRLWTTCRRSNSTIRVERCLGGNELKTLNIKDLLTQGLGWSISDSQTRTGRKRHRGTCIKQHGDHGFYVEILPFAWTLHGQHEQHLMTKEPTCSIDPKIFTNDPDYPTDAYGQEGSDFNKLGTHLTDDVVSAIYCSNVPDVPPGTCLLFFKEFLIDSCLNSVNDLSNDDCSNCGYLKYIGSALIERKEPVETLELILQKLKPQLGEQSSVQDNLNCNKRTRRILEIITPRNINDVTEMNPGKGKPQSKLTLYDADIGTGDLFCTCITVSPDSTCSVDYKEQLSLHLKMRQEQVWVHLLPLTAKDAEYIPVFDKVGTKMKGEVDPNHESEQFTKRKMPPSMFSLAVHPCSNLALFIELVFKRLRSESISSSTQIRYTRTEQFASKTAHYAINPNFSFLFSDHNSSPSFIPPTPQRHPVNFTEKNILKNILSPGIQSLPNCAMNEDEKSDFRLDVKWLTSFPFDPTILNSNRKKTRHYYLYFDILDGYDLKCLFDRDTLQEKYTPVSCLVGGYPPALQDIHRGKSQSKYLPLTDFTSMIHPAGTIGDYVANLHKSLITKTDVQELNLQLSNDSETVFLPVLFLMKRGRISSILPYNTILKHPYKQNEVLELPRGRAEIDNATFLHRNRNKRRAKDNDFFKALKWNLDAKNACVEKSSVDIGTLVLDYLPFNSIFSANGFSQDMKFCTKLLGRCFNPSHLDKQSMDMLDKSISELPCVMPIQVIFHLPGRDNKLNAKFIPLLSYIRKSDSLEKLRKRIFDRIQGIGEVSVKSVHQNYGSPLTWKVSFVSFDDGTLEDLPLSFQCDGHKSSSYIDEEFCLWQAFKDKWQRMLDRGGDMKKIFRYLTSFEKSVARQEEISCEENFKCSDLPTIGFHLPVAAFNDFVRCRARNVVGGAQYFTFEENTGKLHSSFQVPSLEGSIESQDDMNGFSYKNYHDGIVINK